MKEQFEQIIEQMATADISIAPNYITMKALANHPEAHYPNPEVVAASIKINVNQNFVNDTDLFKKTVDTYVGILNRMYNQILTDFGSPARYPYLPYNKALPIADQVFASTISSQGLVITYNF